MKILVAVESRHNSTREIAETIACELRSSGLEVDLLAADAVLDIAGYEAVILGSAVYTGGWLRAAKRLALVHGSALKAVPVWLFSSGPIGTDDDRTLGDMPEVPELLNATQAREHRVFAGKLDKRGLGLAERFVSRVVQAPEGDFRDWDEVRSWARSIAASLARVQTRSI